MFRVIPLRYYFSRTDLSDLRKKHKESKMNILWKVVAPISLTVITGMTQTVWADTTRAHCEVYHQGEEKPKASGSCTFSQRQGYIDIKLSNGHTINLSPGNKADHFTDKKGDKVERTREGGSKQRYKWESKRIDVTFNGGNKDQSQHSSGKFGETPHNLRDLIGQRGGEAEDKLQARGYAVKNSSKSGNSVYSNWKEHSTGRCIALRTVNGVYKSIVYAPEYDCKQ